MRRLQEITFVFESVIIKSHEYKFLNFPPRSGEKLDYTISIGFGLSRPLVRSLALQRDEMASEVGFDVNRKIILFQIIIKIFFLIAFSSSSSSSAQLLDA